METINGAVFGFVTITVFIVTGILTKIFKGYGESVLLQEYWGEDKYQYLLEEAKEARENKKKVNYFLKGQQ